MSTDDPRISFLKNTFLPFGLTLFQYGCVDLLVRLIGRRCEFSSGRPKPAVAGSQRSGPDYRADAGLAAALLCFRSHPVDSPVGEIVFELSKADLRFRRVHIEMNWDSVTVESKQHELLLFLTFQTMFMEQFGSAPNPDT